MIDYTLVPDHAAAVKSLLQLDTHLGAFPVGARSAQFEKLVAQSVACLLHLPFYDQSTDPAGVGARVTWNGQGNTLAPQGADGLARAFGCWIVIEATRKTGGNQWTQEFGPCVAHIAATTAGLGANPQDVWGVLLTTQIHAHTFESVKAWNASNPSKLLVLYSEQLASAVETAHLAFTLTHLEVKELLLKLVTCIQKASSTDRYRSAANKALKEWQQKVLDIERRAVTAIAAYQAMLGLAQGGARATGVGQIYGVLLADTWLTRYFELSDGDLDFGLIAESLQSERLGYLLERSPLTSEEVFCPVPLEDFRSRCDRRMRAVEATYAKT